MGFLQNKRSKLAAAMLTAVICCASLTACGDDSATAERQAEQHSQQAAESRTDTGVTGTKPRDTTRRTETVTTKQDLIDRAESAVDDMREDITSLVREGTREVHPFD